MSRRIVAFVALAVGLAVLFVRLGVWQLDRLAERRARNADVAVRLQAPTAPFETLGADATYRRVRVTGMPDTANEIALTGRSRHGSPGVYLLTPLRREQGDSAVIVVRGWVYSPDAATVDPAPWREARREFTGYAQRFSRDRVAPGTRSDPRTPSGDGAARARSAPKVRTLSFEAVQDLLPYPIATHYVVALDSVAGAGPARLPAPTLDEGPHLGYAIQWFAFAAIAIGGAGIVLYRARERARAGSTAA